MLSKRGAARPASPYTSPARFCLPSPDRSFIYLLFIGVPSYSTPVYVNCVIPFNSNIGLKRALNEKSIYNTDHFAIQLSQMDNC